MTTTFLAALRADGLFAPLVIDGPITGDLFRAWVEQHLVHALRPGDIVVMDDLAANKVAGVREAIRAVDADVLYLPPYSPDLNPIEPVFGKIKHEIRKRKPRTKPACDTLCGECLDWFPAPECGNYLRRSRRRGRGRTANGGCTMGQVCELRSCCGFLTAKCGMIPQFASFGSRARYMSGKA